MHGKRSTLKSLLLALGLAVALGARKSLAQSLPLEWQDGLAEQLTGTWKHEGTNLAAEAHHTVSAEWVLHHQFLQIHEKTSAGAPASERPYEAIWFVGYDPVSERYVCHLFDIFGARFSETLGYGTRDGNAIRFVFEYPDGPFHTTYRWSPQNETWQWLLEQKDKSGKWITFADLKLRRPPQP